MLNYFVIDARIILDFILFFLQIYMLKQSDGFTYKARSVKDNETPRIDFYLPGIFHCSQQPYCNLKLKVYVAHHLMLNIHSHSEMC